MVEERFVRTESGSAEVAPQRTQRCISPLSSMTLSRFHALRVLTLLPSCPLQLWSIQSATFAGGSEKSHAPLPPAPFPPTPPLPLPPAPPLPEPAPPDASAPP